MLSWLATHPWVEVVTTDDLTNADVVGELDLLRASDPYIEEQWRLPNPPAEGHDNGLAYDTWYAAWADTPAAWLGETLRAVSDRAEQAIERAKVDDPDEVDELLLLARLYFLMCLHESQWSKRPRIEPGHDGFDHCENFVAAESLQLRNAHVYLAARHWARWARDGGAGAHRDDGPVVAAVAEAGVPGPTPRWWRPEQAGLQWDHDPLTNVVLYNEQALVVLDRNGGRITHLFALIDGRPVAVSGTYKAYQSWTPTGPPTPAWSATGWCCRTPSPPRTTATPPATSTRAGHDGLRPPTAGDSVCATRTTSTYTTRCPATGSRAFTYGPGRRDGPATIAALDALLAHDRAAKVAGQPGPVLHDIARSATSARRSASTAGPCTRLPGPRPGHRVANDSASTCSPRRYRAVARPLRCRRRAQRHGHERRRPHVGVELDLGCGFSDAVAPRSTRRQRSRCGCTGC